MGGGEGPGVRRGVGRELGCGEGGWEGLCREEVEREVSHCNVIAATILILIVLSP